MKQGIDPIARRIAKDLGLKVRVLDTAADLIAAKPSVVLVFHPHPQTLGPKSSVYEVMCRAVTADIPVYYVAAWTTPF